MTSDTEGSSDEHVEVQPSIWALESDIFNKKKKDIERKKRFIYCWSYLCNRENACKLNTNNCKGRGNGGLMKYLF